MIVGSIMVWGTAIACFGLARSLPLALILLAVAGAADVVSAVFRGVIVQLTVPENLRGRISGVHVAVVGSGPRLGDVRAGALATATSEQFAVVSGGIMVLIGTLIITKFYPELLESDNDDDPGDSIGDSTRSSSGEEGARWPQIIDDP
jgi:hypothetical protein